MNPIDSDRLVAFFFQKDASEVTWFPKADVHMDIFGDRGGRFGLCPFKSANLPSAGNEGLQMALAAVPPQETGVVSDELPEVHGMRPGLVSSGAESRGGSVGRTAFQITAAS